LIKESPPDLIVGGCGDQDSLKKSLTDYKAKEDMRGLIPQLLRKCPEEGFM